MTVLDLQEVIEALEKVLPEETDDLKDFSNFDYLWDSLQNKEFLKCNDLKYLRKAKTWLTALMGKCTEVFLPNNTDKSILITLGIQLEDSTWAIQLQDKHKLAKVTRTNINTQYEYVRAHPELQFKKVEITGLQNQDDSQYFDFYLERARLMLQDNNINTFYTKIENSMKDALQAAKISLQKNPQLRMDNIGKPLPYWIVCSSSGTGKSQMAYTLSLPVAYFIMTEGTDSTNQDLYKPFSDISTKFFNIYSNEYREYIAKHPESYKLSMGSLPDLHSYKFEIVGFIVSLFRSMINEKTKKILTKIGLLVNLQKQQLVIKQ